MSESLANLQSRGKDEYSTSETLTNKVWIDGKPIYRKVCQKSFGTITDGIQSDLDFSDLLPNVDYVMPIFGECGTLILNQAWDKGSAPYVYFIRFQGTRVSANRSYFSNLQCTVIYEYTKS